LLLGFKTEMNWLSKHYTSLQNYTIQKVPRNIVPVNVSHTLFSLFDLLTFEDGTDRLSRNVGKE
jgi:hypothetical protein